MRSWQICFVASAAVIALQYIPAIGIFLMMLAAPLWSAVLINLGFALMARDAWRGEESWQIGVFPVLWFGGYLVVAAISHWQAHQFNDAIAAANDGVRVRFNPDGQDLLIDPDASDSNAGSELTPETMVSMFGLPRAYWLIHTDFHSDKRKTQRYQLVGTSCGWAPGTGRQGISIYDGGYGTDRKRKVAEHLCIFIAEATPEYPTVKVQMLERVEKSGLANTNSQDILITTPDGKARKLRSGSAIPLTWFPIPIIGCALNGGSASWDCFASFNREKLYDSKRDRTPNGPDDVVAHALGLVKASIRVRNPDVTWR